MITSRRSIGGFLLFGAAVAVFPSVLWSREPQAQSTERVLELRILTARPGRLGDLQAVFRTVGTTLLAKYEIENIFAGTVLEGAASDGPDAGNMLIWIVGHRDRATAERSWASLEADPEWRSALAMAEQREPLLAKPAVSTYMVPTDYSPVLNPPASGAAAPARVFELRKYNTGAAALQYTTHRFKVGIADLITSAGMAPVWYWTATDDSAFIYLIASRDRETARALWDAFLPPYRTFQTEYPNRKDAVPPAPRTPEDNRFLVPTEYSALR